LANPNNAQFQVVNAAMPERSPGEPVWLEVPCVNPDRAMAFYNAVFGWEASKSMPTPLPTFVEGIDALYPFEKGKLRGGFSKMANGASDIASAGSGWAKHGPVMELFVKDIDETTAKVVAAGGTVHAYVFISVFSYSIPCPSLPSMAAPG